MKKRLLCLTLSVLILTGGVAVEVNGEVVNPKGVVTGGVEGVYAPHLAEELRVRRGLPNVLAKLEAGGPVRVAYLGGSITQAAHGWRPMTFAWLEKQYPQAELAQVDATVSGTGADFAAGRLAADLLPHRPDLVLIEFRVNGGGKGLEARSIEGIVRQLRAADAATDICLVYTIGEWMLKDLEAGKQTRFGRIMEEIANAYGVPSIDFGPEVVRKLEANALVFKADAPVDGKVVFSRDGVHPGVAGHTLYADVFARSWGVLGRHRGETKPYAMPEPLNAQHMQNATLLPIASAQRTAGWVDVNPETDAVYTRDRRRSRDMLREAVVTADVGETLTLDWEGTRLVLTHIPQGQGITIEVVNDDREPETYVFTQTSEQNLYAQFQPLDDLPQGEHTTRITVTALPEGTAFYAGQCLLVRDPLP